MGSELATVQVEANHFVRFYEVEPGMISVVETAPIGRPSTLTGRSSSAAELFKALAPSSPVPDALVAAQARRAALMSAAPAATQPAPSETAAAGSGPMFYTDAEQAWARSVLCAEPIYHENVLQDCVQGWTWANTRTSDQGSFYDTFFLLGSEATAPASTEADAYYCDFQFIIQADCYWHVVQRSTVAPGYYAHTWVDGQTGIYFKSSMAGGGNATVTIADYVSWAGLL